MFLTGNMGTTNIDWSGDIVSLKECHCQKNVGPMVHGLPTQYITASPVAT